MSNNDSLKERNKILFETRLQMKPKSGLKINNINIRTNINKLKKRTNLCLYKTEIFSNDIISNKRKNQLDYENSLNNFTLKNISKDKINKTIKKNHINNILNNINNKSKYKIKDISFFQNKNTRIKNAIQQIISVNKKRTSYNNSYKKFTEYNSLKKIESRNISNRRQNGVKRDIYSFSHLDFTFDISKKNISSKYRVAMLDKKNEQSKTKRNSSNIRKYNKYFLIQKIKIIKKKNKNNSNNINLYKRKSKNDITVRTKFINKTNNIKNSFTFLNHKVKNMRNTCRNILLTKNFNTNIKNSFKNINYYTNININNSSILNNYKKKSERSLNINNINKLFINKKINKIIQNKINNRKNNLNKLRKEIIKNVNVKQSKNNKTARELNNILINKKINDNKYIDKKEEIVDDFNINTTKTNDEFEIFSEENEKKIEETSIEEESGILSMNEIEDIIIYHNMKNINKNENYLFKKNDYDIFISKNRQQLYSLFFEIENDEEKKK